MRARLHLPSFKDNVAIVFDEQPRGSLPVGICDHKRSPRTEAGTQHHPHLFLLIIEANSGVAQGSREDRDPLVSTAVIKAQDSATSVTIDDCRI